MRVFVSGGGKSGKSGFAQQLAVSLAQGGKHYYLATMIPVDEEDRARIRRHVADREGLGFETIECGGDLLSALDQAEPEGTFLLDSVTALLQNAMFPVEKNYEMDLQAAENCAMGVVTFAKSVRNAVIVSDYIYSDAQRYDETTESYRRCLARIDRLLAQVCDTVVEVSAGQLIFHKGGLPA
ncbi:MAG: bifunctional adenosylcobinamide kinase/adenosylcobinamide-phosphate guanylyltransferase [Faecousia sp.]